MGKFMFIKIFYKHNLNKATLMLQDDYQRLVKKENKWGSVICQVSKIEPERKIDTFYYLYTKNNLLYTALPAVITTQYILEGKTKIGLNCLCDSLNCQSFMSDLDFYGIKSCVYVVVMCHSMFHWFSLDIFLMGCNSLLHGNP